MSHGAKSAHGFIHLQLEVELHVAPARVVRVLPEHVPKYRLPQVQVAVLQKVFLLGVSARDERVCGVGLSGSLKTVRYV